MGCGSKREMRTSEAGTLVGQVTRGAGGQVGQGRARTGHAARAVPEAVSGAIVLKINPKLRRRLPLWRRAGTRSKKKKNLSAFFDLFHRSCAQARGCDSNLWYYNTCLLERFYSKD